MQIYNSCTNPMYYANLSLAYYKLDEIELALTTACKAVELEPNYNKGCLRIGSAAFSLDYYQEHVVHIIDS